MIFEQRGECASCNHGNVVGRMNRSRMIDFGYFTWTFFLVLHWHLNDGLKIWTLCCWERFSGDIRDDIWMRWEHIEKVAISLGLKSIVFKSLDSLDNYSRNSNPISQNIEKRSTCRR